MLLLWNHQELKTSLKRSILKIVCYSLTVEAQKIDTVCFQKLPKRIFCDLKCMKTKVQLWFVTQIIKTAAFILLHLVVITLLSNWIAIKVPKSSLIINYWLTVYQRIFWLQKNSRKVAAYWESLWKTRLLTIIRRSANNRNVFTSHLRAWWLLIS